MFGVMDLPLWDMPHWDPWDDQSYPILSYERNFTADHGWNVDYYCQGLVANQSSYYGEDYGQSDFDLRYKYEDALNEKCCIHVLKALIHKADEDILKLEEDILMLKCQLEWDNEELSEPCSVVLNKRIDHLDGLIQSLTNDANYVDDVRTELEEPEKVTQRFHDLLKPLLEHHFLVKSKKGPIAEKAAVKNTEDKKTLSDLKLNGYQRTTEYTCSPFSEPVKKAKTTTHKKGEDIISKIFKNAHQYAKEMNKLNKQTGKEVPKSAPAISKKGVITPEEPKEVNNLNKQMGKVVPKSAPTMSKKRSIITSEEPSFSIVKQDTYPSRTKKSDTRGSGLVGNNEVLTTAKVNGLEFAEEMDKLNKQTRKEVPKSAPPMSKKRSIITLEGPSISIVKQDTNPSRTKKSDTRGSALVGNNEVFSTAKVNRLEFAEEMDKLNQQTGKEVPKSAPTMSEKSSIFTSEEPSISIAKEDTNPSKTKKFESRTSGLVWKNEVLSTAEVSPLELLCEIKTTNSYLRSQGNVGEVIQPSMSIVKQDTNPSRTNKSDPRGRGLLGNNEFPGSAEVHQLQVKHDIKTTNAYLKSQEKVGEVVQPAFVIWGEEMIEESPETRETRTYRHAINKDLFSKKSLAKQRKLTSFPERANTLLTQESETVEFDDSVTLLELFNLKRKYPRRATEETTDKHQEKQINNLVIKLDNSNYHMKPDHGPEITYVRKQEIASMTCVPEETLQGLRWTEKGDASQVIHALVSS